MVPADLMGSYAVTTKMLVSATNLGIKYPGTSLVSIVDRCAILAIEDGSQIGTEDILDNITLDDEIEKLHKIGQGLIQLDTTLESSLNEEERSFSTKGNDLMTQLKQQIEAEKWPKEKQILTKLEQAPDKPPFKEKYSNADIEILEQKSSVIREEAFKLLTAIQHAQQKRLEKYNQLLNIVDETKKSGLATQAASTRNVEKLKGRFNPDLNKFKKPSKETPAAPQPTTHIEPRQPS